MPHAKVRDLIGRDCLYSECSTWGEPTIASALIYVLEPIAIDCMRSVLSLPIFASGLAVHSYVYIPVHVFHQAITS